MKSFNILVIGPVGTGKSFIINQLFTEDVVKSEFSTKPITKEVAFVQGAIQMEKFPQRELLVIDTPGIGNDGYDTHVLETYIEAIRQKVKKIDKVMVVCLGELKKKEISSMMDLFDYLQYTEHKDNFVFIGNKCSVLPNKNQPIGKKCQLLHVDASLGTFESGKSLCIGIEPDFTRTKVRIGLTNFLKQASKSPIVLSDDPVQIVKTGETKENLLSSIVIKSLVIGPSSSGKSTLINNLLNFNTEDKSHVEKFSCSQHSEFPEIEVVVADIPYNTKDVPNVQKEILDKVDRIDNVVVVCNATIGNETQQSIKLVLDWLRYKEHKQNFVLVVNNCSDENTKEKVALKVSKKLEIDAEYNSLSSKKTSLVAFTYADGSKNNTMKSVLTRKSESQSLLRKSIQDKQNQHKVGLAWVWSLIPFKGNVKNTANDFTVIPKTDETFVMVTANEEAFTTGYNTRSKTSRNVQSVEAASLNFSNSQNHQDSSCSSLTGPPEENENIETKLDDVIRLIESIKLNGNISGSLEKEIIAKLTDVKMEIKNKDNKEKEMQRKVAQIEQLSIEIKNEKEKSVDDKK